MILYNPFTGAFKLVPDLLCDDLVYCSDHIYGFDHGATVDDLKIVRIDKRAYYENHDTFHVFSFRTNSWSRSRNYNIEDIRINHNDVGLEVSNFAPLNILEDGRILMLNNSKNKLVIYDTLKQSYEFQELSQKLDYSRDLRGLNGIEYVETLASPSDLFAV
ncbi:hypothetical protein Tco_0472253 [Tanacetum coccineum]